MALMSQMEGSHGHLLRTKSTLSCIRFHNRGGHIRKVVFCERQGRQHRRASSLVVTSRADRGTSLVALCVHSKPNVMSTATSTTTDTARIVRVFKAPVKAVWKAWTDEATFKKWWGPRGFSCPSAKLDVRDGAKSVMAMHEEKTGKTTWSTFTYHEVMPEKRLYYLDQFADEKGKPITPEAAGMPGKWEKEMNVTVTFEEKDGATEMRIKHEGLPADQVSDCEQGWNSSLDKMAEVVENR
jgi:uncharacterized protein YndB with AHSA1/START domain